FLFGDPERRPAATSRDHVRVVDLEAGALETIDEVDHRALDVRETRVGDQQTDALVLEHGVAVGLPVERHCILKTAATTAPHSNPESGRAGHGRLSGEELADLLRALVSESDHASRSIASASRYACGMSTSPTSATPEELKARIEAGIPGSTAVVT